MINIRNFKGKYLFLHVNIWKSLRYFLSLLVFNDNYSIRPRKFLFGNRLFIVKPGRLSLESAFKCLFGCLASVLVLVADKQYFHIVRLLKHDNLNFFVIK